MTGMNNSIGFPQNHALGELVAEGLLHFTSVSFREGSSCLSYRMGLSRYCMTWPEAVKQLKAGTVSVNKIYLTWILYLLWTFSPRLRNTVWHKGFAFFFAVFAWATDLSTDLEYQLSVSCKCYEAAYEILLFSNLKSQNPEQHIQVLKRMGNIRNEIGVFYMNQAAAVQTERVGKYPFSIPDHFMELQQWSSSQIVWKIYFWYKEDI